MSYSLYSVSGDQTLAELRAGALFIVLGEDSGCVYLNLTPDNIVEGASGNSDNVKVVYIARQNAESFFFDLGKENELHTKSLKNPAKLLVQEVSLARFNNEPCM